jgi:glycosyltransferase involved in cell wall biosynthesis
LRRNASFVRIEAVKPEFVGIPWRYHKLNPKELKTLDISIGILAYNEAESIALALSSLFQQSIFRVEQGTIEIVVVPNGCTDSTAAIAKDTLKKLVEESAHPSLKYQVCDIKQPGKSNAWNCYVHEYSAVGAEYTILMDADIQFLNPRTLEELLGALQSNPETWVTVGYPIKDVALKAQKNLIDRLSIAVSKSPEELLPIEHPNICGQLYCGRSSVLRQIWMPIGLPVEDGFLRAIACTENFTMPEGSHRRIQLVPSATHVFEAYTNVIALLSHEKRIIIGSVINALLFDYLWKNCSFNQPAGTLIRQRNQQDPNWLSHLLQEKLREQGWWVIPSEFFLRRLQGLQSYSLAQKILRFSLVILASFADWFVCIQANAALKRGEGIGYWGTK